MEKGLMVWGLGIRDDGGRVGGLKGGREGMGGEK